MQAFRCQPVTGRRLGLAQELVPPLHDIFFIGFIGEAPPEASEVYAAGEGGGGRARNDLGPAPLSDGRAAGQ